MISNADKLGGALGGCRIEQYAQSLRPKVRENRAFEAQRLFWRLPAPFQAVHP
jgi:hypothetical protein